MSRLYVFRVRGNDVRLRVDSAQLFPLAEVLHSCARVSAGPCDSSSVADVVWKVRCDERFAIELLGQPWEDGLLAEAVFLQSENLITHLFSDRHGDKLQFHAGAVVLPSGQGMLIAGDSGAGKTSLTLALLLEGWRWLSDELILIDRFSPREMIGVPRNFNIKERSFDHFPETETGPNNIEITSTRHGGRIRFIDPEDLVPGMFLVHAPLAGILFPLFCPNLSETECHPCKGTRLSGKLISAIFRGQSWTTDWVVGAVMGIPAWELHYQNPRSAARFLQTLSFVDCDGS